MKDGKAYFSAQEEKISNTYMNVNGEGDTGSTPDVAEKVDETNTEGYGNIFTQKNYWIGVAVGIASVLLYQKMKKKK